MDSYKDASPVHLQHLINAMTGSLDEQDNKDIMLRERPYFYMQEWKSKVVIRGLDKSTNIKIDIPMAPVGFYAVRDGTSLYIIGGKENNFNICKNILDFDLKERIEANRIRMKMPRYYHSVALLRKVTSTGYKSEIIIIGGENTECPYFDTKYEKIGAVIDAAFETVTNDNHKSNKKNFNSTKKNL